MACETASNSRMAVKSVLVLGGGPDAEREVSLNSAREVTTALKQLGSLQVNDRTIDRLTPETLRALPGDVIMPMLHGSYGEGGPLQELLEADGRPYVGCGSQAARIAMDKLATKMRAMRLGIQTADCRVFNPKDPACPLELPVVLKPVHDGSSVGLHIVKTMDQWRQAREAVLADQREHPGRAYMVEAFIPGQEMTVGILDGEALPVIRIIPAQGPYDYEAKYTREDTRYEVDPDVPVALKQRMTHAAVAIFKDLGGRHLSRADFLVDATGTAWFLEINTMPGFTSHSLVPMAARHRGIAMPKLCERLVELACRDHAEVR